MHQHPARNKGAPLGRTVTKARVGSDNITVGLGKRKVAAKDSSQLAFFGQKRGETGKNFVNQQADLSFQIGDRRTDRSKAPRSAP
ncbi:hypothetical protein MUK42_28485 [Musa troglodytarum]|uniref:Uncharacterized protein n=1 Tax=Musa troglodytarum TaxID=320322 RepID=A0A9E7F5U9_9LILI|nr:hypothetical protein MUK42_28485 [Musa troglodytarum]